MKLVFVLFHYFPYGGLERDMLALAVAARKRGHDVTIVTGAWEGPKPSDIPVHLLPTPLFHPSSFTNHGRAQLFARAWMKWRQIETFDFAIGFNKLPGLDVYYAADVCFTQKARKKPRLLQTFSRYKAFMALENAVFSTHPSAPEVWFINASQANTYAEIYPQAIRRGHQVPPSIRPDIALVAFDETRRAAKRKAMNVAEHDIVFIMIGSDFRRKGVDRSLNALGSVKFQDDTMPVSGLHLPTPRVHCWIVGDDKAISAPSPELASKVHVQFLGARDDVVDLLSASDILLHPARSEAAGIAILEGAVAGCSVIVTDVCGFAPYIKEWSLGVVIQGDTEAEIHAGLTQAITQTLHLTRSERLINARTFCEKAHVFSGYEWMLDRLENLPAQ
jgi:UDP-glucose:(heptosyl)LPS alpha-1,3-glucosyltransferase